VARTGARRAAEPARLARRGARTRAGGGADARSVVLREVAPAKRRLVFFTDARSAKVQQIEAQPEGVLVMWSRELSWQLRLAVTLEVATSGLSFRRAGRA